jgi:hypothetical protein
MHKAQIKISLHENKSTAAKNQEDRTGRGNFLLSARDIFLSSKVKARQQFR